MHSYAYAYKLSARARRRCRAATRWARRCSSRGRARPFRPARSGFTASRASAIPPQRGQHQLLPHHGPPPPRALCCPPRLRPTRATLPTRPVRSRDSLCRGAPALTA
eukprot:scaffold48791_cov59-Phaeocystis_antarctica.AAC.6